MNMNYTNAAFCLVIGSALLSLSGCATSPENIAPAYISELTYMNYTCEQLAQEQSRLVSARAATSDAQRRAHSGDAVGVLFLGVPTSTLSGSNMASEVARLKGELQGLQKAAVLKDCNLPPVQDPTAKKKMTPKKSVGGR